MPQSEASCKSPSTKLFAWNKVSLSLDLSVSFLHFKVVFLQVFVKFPLQHIRIYRFTQYWTLFQKLEVHINKVYESLRTEGSVKGDTRGNDTIG